MHLTNDLMNRVDWLKDFCILIVIEKNFSFTTIFFCIFDIGWVPTAVVLVQNALFLVHTESLRAWFSQMFFNKSMIKRGKIFSCQKNMGNDQKPRCSYCITTESHNFKILAFLLYCDYTPQLKNIAITAIAFSPHNYKLLPTR